MKNEDTEEAVGRLLDQARSVLSDDDLTEARRLFDSGEFEMALEGAILELSGANSHPPSLELDEWRSIARFCKLDEGGVFKDDIWQIMEKWLAAYTG